MDCVPCSDCQAKDHEIEWLKKLHQEEDKIQVLKSKLSIGEGKSRAYVAFV